MAPAGPWLVLCEEKIREKSGLAPHHDLALNQQPSFVEELALRFLSAGASSVTEDAAELRSLSIPGTYQEKITHLGNSLMHLTGLKSLDLSRNSLVSLEGIQYLTALESLNLYYNSISSLAEVLWLHSLTELTDVDFRLNPVVKNESDYRLFVVYMLPKLRQLDDRPVRDSERKHPATVCIRGVTQLEAELPSRFHSRKCFSSSLNSSDGVVDQFFFEKDWRVNDFGFVDHMISFSTFEFYLCSMKAAIDCLAIWSPWRFQMHFKMCFSVSAKDVIRILIAKKCLVMDADDEAVLNLIAECEWDLSNPPGSTSSSLRERETDLHSSQDSGHLLSPHSMQHQCGDSIKKGHERKKGSSRGCGPEKRLQHQYCGELPPQCGPHAHFTPHPDSADIEDPAVSQKSSLSTQMVVNPLPVPEKYRKRRMPGGRFQAPANQEFLSHLEKPAMPSSPEETLSRHSASEGRSERTFSHSEVSEPEGERPHSRSGSGEVAPRLYSAVPPGKKAALEVMLLEALLDLVDRYWSGCKSLHGNEVFQAQARHILSSVQEFTTTQDSSTLVSEEISYLTLENKSLQKHLAEQQQQYHVKINEVASELSNTQKEMDDLKQHLDKSLEENSSLKALLFSMKKEAKNADTAATLNVQITGLQTSVKRLSDEIVELKQHLTHYDKIQELTQMLQESHSSLVSTNEHLLQELSQVRAQHQAEVEQLHWSYKELKKTLALFPHGSASLGGC